MKISASKAQVSHVQVLGGLCALLVGAGNVAFAQSDDHQDRNNDAVQSRQDDRYHDHGQNNQYGQQGQDHHGPYHQDSYHYSGGQDDQYLQSGQYRRSAQYRHADQAERRRLDRLHAAYARAASNGNYGAAERAHQHAQAIRAHLRAQHGDNNQGRHDIQDRHDTN